MKNMTSGQRGGPLNSPTNGDVFTKMLEAMTVEELTDGLNEALESMTEENYDPALIDAYLAALDRKDPMPEVPNVETSFSDFQKKVSQAFFVQKRESSVSRHRLHHFARAGLAAVLAIAVLMSGMVVAQAAGIDVFGAMARWTDAVFSFGTIRSDGTNDVVGDKTSENKDVKVDYASLQEALDTYGITEFHEPTWIPDGYLLENIEVDLWPADNSLIGLFAKYYDGANFLQIQVECYEEEAHMQVEKTNASVETFSVGGFTVYLLENVNSNSAAWTTEHYECYISSNVEKEVLKQIVLSVYADNR